MENQLNHREELEQSKSLIKTTKIGLVLYLLLPYILFSIWSLQDPSFLVELIDWHISNWLDPIYILNVNMTFFLYWSPVLFIVEGFSYFYQMANISRIPPTSSLYDAIMSPTIQYGPLKINLPVFGEEELIKENQD
ncbi:MAG: hypothetical protein ACFFB2_01280 [Promethearchaeota archaeon]